MISITVVYANIQRQVEVELQVEENCTIAIAIQRSGLLKQFPEIKLNKAVVGIFNKKAALDDLVKAGDRVEIYRPLIIDPKQARLLRAKINARRSYNG